MGVFEIYKKRRKREQGQTPEIYTYDKIPRSLKVQIIHIWREAIGMPTVNPYGDTNNVANIYQSLIQILRKEYGTFRFSEDTANEHDARYAFHELCQFFLQEKPADDDLSIIELTFRCIDKVIRAQSSQSSEIADEALKELNIRFGEHSVGYQFLDAFIIRRDLEYLHVEATKPALIVLREAIYTSAQEEILGAHRHYRHGQMTEALVDAGKAFESTMKIICAGRKWKIAPSATASQLIQACLDNGLIPPYWQAHFSHLRGVLEASIPTARNKQAAHGAGTSRPHNSSARAGLVCPAYDRRNDPIPHRGRESASVE